MRIGAHGSFAVGLKTFEFLPRNGIPQIGSEENIRNCADYL